jgi:hypothetical protein
MRAALCVLLAVAVGCGKKGGEVTELSGDRITEFADHPERFKGKTIRAELSVGSPFHGHKGDSLRNHLGEPVDFWATGPANARLNLSVQIPNGIDVPNASYTDSVVVTFVCREGKLATGNEAVRVTRP